MCYTALVSTIVQERSRRQGTAWVEVDEGASRQNVVQLRETRNVIAFGRISLTGEHRANSGNKRVIEKAFGLLSLNGAPKKPHTAGPFVKEVTDRRSGQIVIRFIRSLCPGDVDVENRGRERHPSIPDISRVNPKGYD
jgi:hypothetical protein